ncbi:MAG: lipid-A-disaccharide synthase [Alphaproteobacteria bacterium]|nr:lipid-A-disaccharide synthase [Alphaproteobacteria bacterium]USO07767.1 MAG: lipid-A-disaccharide synthase [Rhodospirillales bacterium]
MNDDALIYLVAGEMSGDLLGARLVQAIRHISGRNLRFAGVGGAAMAAAGVPSLFPIRDLSVMGLAEVLPRLPRILGRLSQCARDIVARQPAIVVTIDSPGFCFRLVRKLRDKCPNTKFIHYVAPQVWAWKPERAAKVAQLFDGLMCLLPFEPPYFTAHGLRAAFVGHPAVNLHETLLPEGREAFFEKYDLSLTNPPAILSLLFGSREGEINRLGPPIYEAAYRILREWPNLAVLVPTVPHLWARLKAIIGSDQRFIPVDSEDRFQAFALSQAAIATSGTVGLELAMLGVPHVVAYRFSAPTFWLAKRMVKVPHMHLVNLLLNERVVPEFLQNDANGRNLAGAALDLLINRNGVAEREREGFARAYRMLLGEGGGTPAEQAASFVMGYL